MTSQYAFARKGSDDGISTNKIGDGNVYNRRSRSIAAGVAPPSGKGQPSSTKNANNNQIVMVGNQNENSRTARYGAKWAGTVTREGHEEEFNMEDLQIGADGKLKGSGKDEAGEFKFEGIHGRGEVNCTQTYKSRKVIYYSGKINEELNELTGTWSMSPGGNDGEFRIYKL